MYNTTQLYRLFPRPKLCTKRFTHNVRVYDHILFLMQGLNGPSHRERESHVTGELNPPPTPPWRTRSKRDR